MPAEIETAQQLDRLLLSVRGKLRAACDTLNKRFSPSGGPIPEQLMPKLKTHKGASKRFKKTGTGKIKRHHAFARHILTSKSRSRKRRLVQGVVTDPANSPEVKRMLPY